MAAATQPVSDPVVTERGVSRTGSAGDGRGAGRAGAGRGLIGDPGGQVDRLRCPRQPGDRPFTKWGGLRLLSDCEVTD